MKNDFHVDYLLEKISATERKNTVVFQTETFPTSSNLCLKLGTRKPYLEIDGQKIFISNITAIWYRRPAKCLIDNQITNEDIRKYAEEESQQTLLGLWESLNDCIWVSKPSNISRSSHKWEQLLRARKIGFNVPRTTITNDPRQAKKFCYKMKKCIVKAVSKSVFLCQDRYRMAYTTLIKHDDSKIDDVKFTPCIFQEYIPKKLELRITVVHKQVFACAIYSQSSAKTMHDWRNYDFENTPHEPWELPNDITEKCINLVASYGLNFGAIDMVLMPNGKYVFIEINPNGQWVWIEDLTGLPISKALIELLFSKNN